jgi:hypothetical protein
VPELEASAVMVSVEFAIPHWLHGGTTTVVGVRVAVGVVGFDGVTVVVSGTGPEKRLNVFMVMVEFFF